MSLLWDDAPELSVRCSAKIIQFPPGKTNYVTLLGVGKGVWTHWTGNRSLPCGGADCTLCPAPHRWRAYLPCVLWVQEGNSNDWKYEKAILELSETNRDTFVNATSGQTFKVTRSNGKQGKALSIEPHSLNKPPTLPAWFPVVPVLLSLWGLSNRPHGFDSNGRNGNAHQ